MISSLTLPPLFAATPPSGLGWIFLLPLAFLLQRLFILAFFRQAQVFMGELHNTGHRFAVLKAGLLGRGTASSVKLDNGLKGSVKQNKDGHASVSLDLEGMGNETVLGTLSKPTTAHIHEIFPPDSDRQIAQVPTGGDRTWRDLWLGARMNLEGQGIWVRETGLLFSNQRSADGISLSSRAAATYILYQENGQSPEESPVAASRGAWDLSIPAAFVFACLYPALLWLELSPLALYLVYALLIFLLWGAAVWIESSSRDRVMKWLTLINRNTGLVRWNAFLFTLCGIAWAVSVAGQRYSTLPLVFVIGSAVLITSLKSTSSPWEVLPPDNKKED